VQTHRSQRYVTMRVGGTARSTRREPWARGIRARATRGIVVPAVMLGVLGAGIAASPAYASSVHPGTHHAVRASAGSKTCKTGKASKTSKAAKKTAAATPDRPWLYIATAVPDRPWLYAPAVIGTRPWLYATSDKVACKSGAAPAVRGTTAAKAHGTPAATAVSGTGQQAPAAAG
jgi:hypothetical protein